MRIGKTRGSKTAAAGLALLLCGGLLAGCGHDAGAGEPDDRITVWSLENLPPRMAVADKVVADFEKESGVDVELVGVDEAQLPQLIMSAAAAGDLPDVIGALPMGQLWQMYGNGLLDTRIASEIVDDLGRATFNPNALRLQTDHGTNLGVPSDAWLQILVYRKDMLAKKGLPKPDSYAHLLRAATAFDGHGTTGISLATDPGDVFTQQSFESMALADDCQLVDDDLEVTLDSTRCREAMATYDALARGHGAPGVQTVDTTRATYFAGKSPMILWSSMILDELAGLRKDALPTCPRCAKDRGYLSDHSGVVTQMKGKNGAGPAQFGEITSWAVTRTAEKAASRSFIRYMLGSGYEQWFSMAPEGKIPVRAGTPDDPKRFEKAWRASQVGVDRRMPMEKAFSPQLLDELFAGVGTMRRWGLAQGAGLLVGATNGELPVPKAIGAMTSGQTSPDEAAADADEEVTALQKSLR